MKSRMAERIEKSFRENISGMLKQGKALETHNNLFERAFEMGKANAKVADNETTVLFLDWAHENLYQDIVSECGVYKFSELFPGLFLFDGGRKELLWEEHSRLLGFIAGFCEAKNIEKL